MFPDLGAYKHTDSGKDDVLVRAIAKSEKEIRRLKEDIELRKWRMVADAMKNEKVCGLRVMKLHASAW